MSWIKSFITYFTFFLFIIGLLEIGSYFIWENNRINGKNLSGQIAINSILQKGYSESSKIISNPYSLYWNNPDFRDKIYGKQYNLMGYRTDTNKNIDDKSLKILVLGGSTTNMWPYIKDKKKFGHTCLKKNIRLF